MGLDRRLLAAGAVLVAALVAVRYGLPTSSSSKPPATWAGSSWEPLGNNVYRYMQRWKTMDIGVFLVKAGPQDALLIDSGAPEGPEGFPPAGTFSRPLLAALDKVLAGAALRLVVLTHGHGDHVGTLTTVLEHYPSAQLVYHELEDPWLSEAKDYSLVPSDHPESYGVWFYNQSAAVTKERQLYLKGAQGDVADAISPAGQPIRWLPPRGLLKYYHLPGHSPGETAFLHTPSKSVIAGDVILNQDWGQGAFLAEPPRAYTPNVAQATASVRKLASLEWDTAWPTHDSGKGVSREALRVFAATL